MVRGPYVRQPNATNRGRPARQTSKQLLKVNSFVRDLLARETLFPVRVFVWHKSTQSPLLEELLMKLGALRGIVPEVVKDEVFEEIMTDGDQFAVTLQRIARR